MSASSLLPPRLLFGSWLLLSIVLCTLRIRRIVLITSCPNSRFLVLYKLLVSAEDAGNGLSSSRSGSLRVTFVLFLRSPANLFRQVGTVHGIFCKPLQARKESDPPVLWFPAEGEDDTGNYFRLATAQAKDRGQHLCLRVGGGSDLGMLRRPSDGAPDRPVAIEAQGFTGEWGSEDVISFFQAQQWSGVQAITRRKKGKIFVGILRACPPPDEKEAAGARLQVWHYVDADDSGLHISVTRAARRQQVAQETFRAQTPRKSFRSQFQQALKDGWVAVNQGWSGDCCFSVLAAAKHFGSGHRSLETAQE